MSSRTPASPRARATTLLLGGALLAVVALSACVAKPPAATPVAVYDNSPTLESSYPSQGYEATSTAELGDLVQLGGTARKLNSAEVTLVTWAYKSTSVNSSYCTNHQITCDATGWTQPVTVKIYAAGGTASDPTVGALLGSATANVHVPWRPEPDGTCPDNKWKDAGGICNNGFAFEATVNLAGANITAPDEVIFGISYNTTHHGASPYGGPGGPYDSLNVAVSDTASSVGTDKQVDLAFLNSTWPGAYSDGGAGGTGTFRADSGWTGYAPMIELYATA